VKNAARTVLTGSSLDDTQAAHSDPNPLSAGRRSTILRIKGTLPQIHRLYEHYEILFS